jgi:hypothetical protein
MKMKEQEYKELFLKLAEKLGWTNVLIQEEGVFCGVYGTPPDWSKWGLNENQRGSMPNWINDDGAVLRLAADHHIDIHVGPNMCKAVVWDGEKDTAFIEFPEHHPDVYTALRIAVINAVIFKLEAA